VACIGLAVIFGALLPLLPQRGAPYYPRSLVTAYYAIAFVPLALLICMWQCSLPNVDRSPNQGVDASPQFAIELVPPPSWEVENCSSG
jgi:hypothetical protein